MSTKLEQKFAEYQAVRAEALLLRKRLAEEPAPQALYDAATSDLDKWYQDKLQALKVEFKRGKELREILVRSMRKKVRQLDALGEEIKGLVGSDAAGVRGSLNTDGSPHNGGAEAGADAAEASRASDGDDADGDPLAAPPGSV